MISQENVLRNPHRRQLFELVARAPGSSVADLARAAGVAHMVAHYHLCVLEQRRLVVGCGGERPRLYFPASASPPHALDAGAVRLLSHRFRRELARVLASRPQGSTYAQLARALGASELRVRYHLGRLARAGLAEGTRTRPRRFAAAPALDAHVLADPPAARGAVNPCAPPSRAAPRGAPPTP